MAVSEKLQGQDQTQKLKRTYKLRFLDRLSTLALLGKACHYYADQQEQIGTVGGQAPQNITVQFVEAVLSPEEAYRLGFEPRTLALQVREVGI